MLLGGVFAVLAVGAMLARLGGDPTAADELARRVDRAEEPVRFSLRYQRGGTQVLACVMANTRFVIDVDTPAGTMVVRRDDEVIALVDADQFLLGGALFREALPTEWLAVRRDRAPASEALVRRVLGVDLAGYLLSPELPATGRATAAAALDAARDVARIAPVAVAGQRADGYRLELDADRYAAAATEPPTSVPPTSSRPAGEAVPVIDVWVTESGAVVRVGIRPQTNSGQSGPAEDGWTVDYRPDTSQPVPRPGPGEVTDVDLVDPARLVPALVGCELGG